MSRGKNGNSNSNSNVASALHSGPSLPTSRNLTLGIPSTSVGANGRLPNGRLSNTVNLGFFVVSKATKRNDVETGNFFLIIYILQHFLIFVLYINNVNKTIFFFYI